MNSIPTFTTPWMMVYPQPSQKSQFSWALPASYPWNTQPLAKNRSAIGGLQDNLAQFSGQSLLAPLSAISSHGQKPIQPRWWRLGNGARLWEIPVPALCAGSTTSAASDDDDEDDDDEDEDEDANDSARAKRKGVKAVAQAPAPATPPCAACRIASSSMPSQPSTWATQAYYSQSQFPWVNQNSQAPVQTCQVGATPPSPQSLSPAAPALPEGAGSLSKAPAPALPGGGSASAPQPGPLSVALPVPLSSPLSGPLPAPLSGPLSGPLPAPLSGPLAGPASDHRRTTNFAPRGYRFIPSYVIVAKRLNWDFFPKFVAHFLRERRWPAFADTAQQFRDYCEGLGVGPDSYEYLPGFAPEWVFHLRQMDEDLFWTVVHYFFERREFPGWNYVPLKYTTWFRILRISEFDFPEKNPSILPKNLRKRFGKCFEHRMQMTKKKFRKPKLESRLDET